jgi:hypothetical protein
MSNLPIQSAIIRNNDNDDQQKIITTTSRITSLPHLQQKQHHERITANNLACDETHDLTSKNSLSMKFVLLFNFFFLNIEMILEEIMMNPIRKHDVFNQ